MSTANLMSFLRVPPTSSRFVPAPGLPPSSQPPSQQPQPQPSSTSSSAPNNRSQLSHSEWSRRLAEVNLSKADLNRLVLDYLIVEGYREAAEEFVQESGILHPDEDDDDEDDDDDDLGEYGDQDNLDGGAGAARNGRHDGMDQDNNVGNIGAITSTTVGSRGTHQSVRHNKRKAPKIELDGIEERMLIRQAVEAGRIDEAIRRTNELDPEILDTNPTLFFHLQLQRLIELLRPQPSSSPSGPSTFISPQALSLALQFATSTLAPLATPSPTLLSLLESTLTILAFPTAPYPAFVEYMLSQAQRRERGKELNEAVLESQGRGVESRLVGVCRLVSWGERKLEENGIAVPRVEGIWSAGTTEEAKKLAEENADRVETSSMSL